MGFALITKSVPTLDVVLSPVKPIASAGVIAPTEEVALTPVKDILILKLH